jgi:phosphoribosylamine-glycine ligase
LNILVIDPSALALDFCLRSMSEGAQVRWFIRNKPEGQITVGDGLVQKVQHWEQHMNWADLVFLPDNAVYMLDLDKWRQRGYPIYGANSFTAQWELDRQVGMDVLAAHGVRLMEGEIFHNYDKAIAYVKSTMGRYVSKPFGDADRSLSYVSKGPADMVYMLEKWKRTGARVPGFILQKFQAGIEMAVGAWVGPHGFASPWCENFEHKKLMNDDCGPNCFTADTEVLTKSGWKHWPDVSMEDEFCTLRDGQITYDKPSQVVVGDFDGELVGWQSHTVDILVTPGHNMYVQDDHRRQGFFFEPALETMHKNRVVRRGAGGKWVGEIHNPKRAALEGIILADGYLKERAVVFGNCPEHKAAEFKQIAAEAGYKAVMYGADLYINSKSLVQSMKDMGLAHEKRVPEWIKYADEESIRAFLMGYAAGDGSRRSNNLIITTASKGMADDLQELCLKAGWVGTINTRDRVGESHMVNGYECINQKVAYDISVSKLKTKAELLTTKARRERYTGKVYCVTVPSHIIYVRRNGKPCWIGQTGEMGTVVYYTEKSKLADKVLKPLENYLVRSGHIGYVDVAVIIDDKGTPWPLEFTMRPGWPIFNIQQQLHRSTASWMLESLNGSTIWTNFLTDAPATGIVLAIPDFPYNRLPRKAVSGVPIYNLDKVSANIHPCELKAGKAPVEKGNKIVEETHLVSAGTYLLVAAAAAPSFEKSREAAYSALKELSVPNSPIYRTDIGGRLRSQLPKLQKLGYATSLRL